MRKLSRNTLIYNTLQKAVFYITKDGLLAYNLWPFIRQKVTNRIFLTTVKKSEFIFLLFLQKTLRLQANVKQQPNIYKLRRETPSDEVKKSRSAHGEK